MSSWSSDNWWAKFEARKFLESSWPEVYRGLSRLMKDPDTRPDFIIADYLVDAARDVSFEYDIPLAMHWPQMPTAMLHAPYIPGTPGLQIDVLSSEYATLRQRFRSAVAIYTSPLHYYRYLQWRKDMRSGEGVSRPLRTLSKPDYLCLVNQMFGLEVAKDVPPNVAAVGPILSDTFGDLTEPYIGFLNKRSTVLYISLGTHVLLPWPTMEKLLSGALAALASGTIDGIIWPIRSMARKQLDLNATITVPVPPSQAERHVAVSELLSGSHPSILMVDFAPQRALLHDPRIGAFLSHGGAASANEAVYAGVPIITLAVYFDQMQNEMRLRDAGVSIPLRKDSFSATDVESAIFRIMQDRLTDGPIMTNVKRMRGLARIAARRKYLAADLIEEVLVDWEGRRQELTLGVERSRYMHLQTADVRMPIWKAKNWDMWAVCMAATLCAAGIVIVLPIMVATHA
ncbi:hypothetical protein AAE478_008985 [Parahypoxylon ruwenzoriense]